MWEFQPITIIVAFLPFGLSVKLYFAWYNPQQYRCKALASFSGGLNFSRQGTAIKSRSLRIEP